MSTPQQFTTEFMNRESGYTRNGKPILLKDIIGKITSCRICHGTNLVAWGSWVPPDHVTFFGPDGSTAPEGLTRSIAYGLCCACFDLRVDDGLPTLWTLEGDSR